MGSLDVDSLFTNIPFDETTDICVNQLLENTDAVKISQSQNLYSYYVWLQRSLILYSTVYFTNKLMVQQWDHLLDLPLLSYHVNTFLSYHEKNWLNNCPQRFNPVFYRRYVDDIFILFRSNDHLKYFQHFLNSCHINMSFSIDTEKENKLSFLDVEIIREQGKFATTVYRKPTFFYLRFINLVWYMLQFIDVFAFAQIRHNSILN